MPPQLDFSKLNLLLGKRAEREGHREREAAVKLFESEGQGALAALEREGKELEASISADVDKEVRGRGPLQPHSRGGCARLA